MKQILLITIIFSILSVLSISSFIDHQANASSDQTVDVVVSFNPTPIIFEDPFEINIIFKNPETGQRVEDVDFATRTSFDSIKHSNIQPRTVSEDGTARSIATLSEDCCIGWNLEITIFGLEDRDVPTQIINIPINVELKEIESVEIPQWVRQDASRWAGKQIDDASYASGIQFLMDEGFLNTNPIPSEFPDSLRQKAGNWFQGSINDQEYFQILENFLGDGTPVPHQTQNVPPISEQDGGSADKDVPKIPEWVKNTMVWYGEGLISEDEIISAIKFLINEGIIRLD